MSFKLPLSLLARAWPAACLVMLSNAPLAHAATLWNGPNISYNQPSPDPTQAANQDRITPTVWLTRANRDRLFNAKTETFCDRSISPTNTEWATGTTNNYLSLTYTTFSGWVDSLGPGNVTPKILNVNAILHIKSDDIYIPIKFTNWVAFGLGGFGYIRGTAPIVAPTPTVTITNPVNSAVFASPANVSISATTSVSSGVITNVAFFRNGVLVGSDQTAPFTATANGLTAASYALTAVATAGGISATSSVVNISVVNPVNVMLSGSQVVSGQFRFSYTANPGLRYVVESSSNLFSWSAIVTSTAPASPVFFTNGIGSNPHRFYRVGRLPNP